ncbi:PWWP domain-containing protein [Citrus sinensis]|nr:PWWP domain-containing protein [Citrus sinensis]
MVKMDAFSAIRCRLRLANAGLVNVDAAISNQKQLAGLGTVIRDSRDKVVAAGISQASLRGSVSHAETEAVYKTKKEGGLLVAFFGDNSYGWFDPFDLRPFDIGYVEKSKQTNDVEFLNAVKDAEDEARRMAALGLSCWCQGTSNFRTTGVKGFVEVDKLASIPHGSLERSIHFIKIEAFVLTYRKAVFGRSMRRAQAYGSQQIQGRNSIGILISQRQIPSEVSFVLVKYGTAQTSGQKTSTAEKPTLEEISLIKPSVQRKCNRVKSQDISPDFQQLQPKVSKVEKISYCLEDLQVVGRTSPPSDAAFHRKVIVTSSDILDEKLRISKCLEEDLLSEHTLLMKREKRKKDYKFKLGLEYWDNGHKKVKRESGEGACGTFSSNFKAREKIDGLHVNSKHSQLLDYLSALALNPFKSVRQNIPATMLQFFLEYTSAVYVKWLSSQQQSLEQLKVVPLSLWSVKCGRITGPEQMSVEEPKRLNELKLLSEEKTEAGDRKLEKPLRRGARMSLKVQEKRRKYSQKKRDTSRKFREPKMMVIQFSSQSALPSVSELKASCARFGQLHSPPCVFWRSSTCQVRFKCKSDAEAAFAHAVKNRPLLFGNMELVVNVPNEAPRVKKHVTTGESTKPRSIAPQHQLSHPSSQPKSCLKKHLDDGATIVHNETPHVKSMSGGQESTSTEQIVAKSIINNHVQPEATNNCPDASCSSSQSIDISDQMLSLLMRWHETVVDLKKSLGYVPITLRRLDLGTYDIY